MKIKREEIRKIQSRLVKYLKADKNSADIGHVLRLPKSLNYKYNPPRPVEFIRANFDQRYTLEELTAVLPPEAIKHTPTPRYTPNYQSTGDQADRAAAALKRLAPWRCHDKDPWIEVGLALSELGSVGLSMWDEWSKGDQEKYNPGECARRWETFKPGAGLTLGSLFWMADQDDPQPKKKLWITRPW